MIFALILLILGFLLLIAGADLLIKGAGSIARRFKVPEIVIGLTIVAFGTSTPELLVNIFSSIKGSADLAFGNIIGSNNFNALIILGLSALLYPLDVKKGTTWKEIPFSLFISVLALFLVNDRWFGFASPNSLSRLDGIILLLIFALFLIYTRHLSRTAEISEDRVKSYSLYLTVGFVIAGFAGLVLGGNLVVRQAVQLARNFGVSEKVIGLTILAAGTSLPELATSVVAALKKRPDIAVGNIIGSNIFNLLFILGISSLINPPLYPTAFNPDFYLMILSSLLLFIFMFASKKHCLDRWEGGAFVSLYLGYAIFFLR